MKKLNDKITAVPQWNKTAKDVWDERFANLSDEVHEKEEKEPANAKSYSLKIQAKYILSIAAAILLIVISTAFLYTKEIKATPGCTCSAILPDGSFVQLSSKTTVDYHPLLWFFSHQVELNGEAFFSGKHIKGFSVKTPQGKIEVLGTSFNARTYDNKLIVTCVDGKIRIKSQHSSIELSANMEATLCDGKQMTEHIADTNTATSWTKGIFSFYNKPLPDVLKEISRYYNIRIEVPEGIDSLRYTGQFSQKKTPEEVLSIIGQPYDITFNISK